ncbi:MAG TPA: hypothetical protein VG759_10305 [Candidatus Angelobacter sp.]|jgi:hypothetical protein|nr:hypothetical protein [Candidatus Angelobacter sp.]
MQRVIEGFEFDGDYMLRLKVGDQATEQHFVSYFGRLLQLKLRKRLCCARHVEEIRREAIARAMAVIRSNSKTPPERLGALVNTACNTVLQKYGPSACCQAGGSVFIHQEKAIEDNDTEKAVVRDLVRLVLHQLPSRDRQTLRSALVKNGSNGKHGVYDNPGLQKEHLRVLLFQARQIFSSKLPNSQRR